MMLAVCPFVLALWQGLWWFFPWDALQFRWQCIAMPGGDDGRRSPTLAEQTALIDVFMIVIIFLLLEARRVCVCVCGCLY
jgi:hypothetical protein